MMKKSSMLLLAAAAMLVASFTVFESCATCGEHIASDGKGNAEIIISDKPTRMGRLAAEQLQEYIEKISGAKLPLLKEKSTTDNIKIYVGKSKYTDDMGINDKELDFDAFRIISDGKQLVLFGNDDDYVPHTLVSKGRQDFDKINTEWDKLTANRTDSKWNDPMTSTHWDYDKKNGWWMYDHRGSLNAVCEFLRILGVRWYMQGELGEILPESKDIELPAIDKTCKPDFPMRSIQFSRFATTPRENMLWYMRLGLNKGQEIAGVGNAGLVHGLGNIMSRDEMKKNHPEYYALWSNKRVTEKSGKPCLSSKGLLEETANYARALFDIYDIPMVSIMPQDGYGRPCECAQCRKEGLATPERGFNGIISDYVFNFINKVAKEIYKTHPDKKLSCCAYGGYFLPPEKIKKLSPNLVICMVHGRKGSVRAPEVRKHIPEIRKKWLELTSNKLLTWEHYPFTQRGTFIPKYFPKKAYNDIKSMKGLSMGEFVEVPTAHATKGQGHSLHIPGFNHLNIYVTARAYWDIEQDFDSMMNEYYEKFYGPAAAEMKKFIEYCELNSDDMERDAEKIGTALKYLNDAYAKPAESSKFHKRIQLVVNFLKPLEDLKAQLEKGRDDVPEVRIFVYDIKTNPRVFFKPNDITLDGKLDDKLWSCIGREFERSCQLVNIETGSKVANPSYFKVAWINNNLYFGVKCTERNMENLKPAVKKHDDMSIWDNDTVEILLETQSHSYYQFVISPDGTLTDLDRNGGGKILNILWDSGAEVKSHKEDGYWSFEIRIPVSIGDTAGDSNHDVVGRMPSEKFPWFFNVCRQRTSGNEQIFSAFPPTGTNSFHVPLKFAKLYVK